MMREDAVAAILDLADACARRNWLPATSGNLSVRLVDCVAMTRSGADKSNLRAEDVIDIGADGRVLGGSPFTPSAEATVHTALYDKYPTCGAIVHVHTVENNVISDLYADAGGVPLSNHELLKALGHWEREAQIVLPIVENFHDLAQLTIAVRDAATDDVPGVLVRNHGIYAWGHDAFAAKRHLEAFEFLFAYQIMRATVASTLPRR